MYEKADRGMTARQHRYACFFYTTATSLGHLPTLSLLHLSQAVAHLELRPGLLLHLVYLDAWRNLRESQLTLLAIHLEDALHRVLACGR